MLMACDETSIAFYDQGKRDKGSTWAPFHVILFAILLLYRLAREEKLLGWKASCVGRETSAAMSKIERHAVGRSTFARLGLG